MMDDPSPKTILLVEDDQDIGEFLVQVFKDERPYHVLYVTDGAHALETVRTMKPNLFLLDYRLPGMHGLELYDRLHASDGLAHVPALMMSANSPPTRGLQQRGIECIAKPFEIPALLSRVDELLSTQQSE